MMGRDASRYTRLVVQVCEVCGSEFPIWRKAYKLKTRDHVKHMYCQTCRRVTAHRQVDEESH